jgi:hypothetical protein
MIKNIDGKMIEEKYGKIKGREFGEKLTEERVLWLKENI